MIETCLFDLGNVLVRFCHVRMCTQIGDLCGQSADQIRSHLMESGLQWDFERGRLSLQQFHREMERRVAATLDFETLLHVGSDIFESDEQVAAIVRSVKEQGMRLVLLSNTSQAHFEFIQRNFPVLKHFDDFVLSYEVGALKPEPEIYKAALEKIQCSPQNCFYTDDIAPYVEAGRTHGLQAEQFVGAEMLAKHLAARGVSVTFK